MTCSWACSLGTVRPLLGPSWFTAEPRITARMRSPEARASERRFNTTVAQPSPLLKPSAAASKVLARPSGARARDMERNTLISGAITRCTPLAKATSASLLRKALQARWTATSDDEQAVSTAMVGPCKPRQYARRPGAKLKRLPVPEYALMALG